MYTSRVGPRHQAAARELVVPIRVDTPLPDYLVHGDTFDQGFLRSWAPGDRFQMFFGAKSASRTGGNHTCLLDSRQLVKYQGTCI